MRRRAALLAVLALGMAGCGGDATEPSGPIRVQVSGDPDELAVYRQVVAAYEREKGGDVQLIEVGDRRDHLAKLVAGSAARRLPDAFLVNHRYMRQFAARGVIEPARVDEAAYHRIALDAFRVDGKLQCVPQNVSSLVVYVNEDKFRRAGISPRSLNSFADFVTAARRLKGTGDRFGVALEPNTIRAAPFVWTAGGELVDDDDKATRFTLDTPQARMGLEALASLRAMGLAPGRKDNEALPPEERFVRGEVGMFLSSRREVPTLRAIEDFRWDVAPFPTLVSPATVLHSDGMCVARGPRAVQARRFVDFALGPRGQSILARGGRTVPSLKATREEFLRSSPPSRQGNEVFLDAIDLMRRLPNTRNWTRTEESVDLAIEGLFYGDLTVDEAVARIEEETSGDL